MAEFLLSNVAEAAYLPSARLAELLDMSQSTVVRLSTALGNAGYPEMQQAFQGRLLGRVGTVNRFEYARYGIDQLPADSPDQLLEGEDPLYQKVFRAETNNIEQMLHLLSAETFE